MDLREIPDSSTEWKTVQVNRPTERGEGGFAKKEEENQSMMMGNHDE